jgi:hypothetical protein
MDVLLQALVGLHHALVDAERRDYEQLCGRVADDEFLHLVINHPDFRWLGALTTIIVKLEQLDGAQLRKLLTPAADRGEFNRKYESSVNRNAKVLAAHRVVMRALDAT